MHSDRNDNILLGSKSNNVHNQHSGTLPPQDASCRTSYVYPFLITYLHIFVNCPLSTLEVPSDGMPHCGNAYIRTYVGAGAWYYKVIGIKSESG